MENCDDPKTTKKISTARFTITPTADFLHALTLKRMNNISTLLEKLALIEQGKDGIPEPEPPASPKKRSGTGPSLLPPLSKTPESLTCKKQICDDEMKILLFKLDQDIKNILGSD